MHQWLVVERFGRLVSRRFYDQARYAFTAINYLGDVARNIQKMQLARLSKLKSVIQRQATRRFLRRAELLKFDPLLRGFHEYYKRIGLSRLKEVKLALIVLSKFTRVMSVKVARAFRRLTKLGSLEKDHAPLIEKRNQKASLARKGIILANLVKILVRKLSTSPVL